MPKKPYIDPLDPPNYVPPQSDITDDPRMPENNSAIEPKPYVNPLAPPNNIDN
jgi:hypothetical protein|tara:strand:- start:221 stop:379 length:159 start_codon:yes stop_codon:yes gene_type:complete